MLRLLFILFFVFLFSTNLYAFDEDRNVRDIPVRERFFVGLSAGLSFSSFETTVVVSPSFGYRISNRFMAGVGGTYQYYNDRSFAASFSTHIYGTSVFSRVLIVNRFFAHGEIELLNIQSRDLQEHGIYREWEYNYLVGPGYRVQVGRNAFFNLMVLYNFNTQSRVYFQNPILRFNFEIGLR